MKNRFDIEVRKGYAVTYHLARGGKETGTVARVAREGGAYRVTLTSGVSCALDDIASAGVVVPSWQEVNPRAYTKPTALLVDFGRVGGPLWCVVGTEYGYLHTTGGDIRTWFSKSGAQRAARAYSAL